VRARQTAERLTLAVSLGGRVLSRFTLGTLPGEEYPLMDLEPEPDPEQAARIPPPVHLTLPGARLAATLYATSFAAARQDVRYYLNGLLFEWHDATLILVATDGHRLANVGLRADIAGEPGQAILPTETVAILAKIGAALGPAPVTLTLHRNRLAVAWPGGDLVSKLIDGKYPDWRRVVPTDRAAAAVWRLPVADLAAALGRVKILAHTDFHGVALEVRAEEPTTLYLTASNTERDEAEESLPLTAVSAPGRWGFRIDYLMDALSHCPTPEMEIRLGDGSTSARLAPGTPGSDTEQDDPEWVVMPMLL
jgi:DNA polymerase-3 subunit beta